MTLLPCLLPPALLTWLLSENRSSLVAPPSMELYPVTNPSDKKINNPRFVKKPYTNYVLERLIVNKQYCTSRGCECDD